MLKYSAFVQLKYQQRTRRGVRHCVTQTSTCVRELQGITSTQSRKHILTSDCEQPDALAIRLVGPECCQDVAVAAVRKHAHSVPQGRLQKCIGEQALQKLQPGRFVKQAFI